MPVKCILLDDKNVVIDNADLSSYSDKKAVIVPFGKETIERCRQMRKVRFQFEKKYDTLYEGEIEEMDDTKIRLKNIEVLISQEQGDKRVDVRVNVCMDGKISYENEEGYFTYDIHMKNISSGGMCFCCREELSMDRIYETVTDWTDPPLVVKVKLLRKKTCSSYGCKFIDLMPEEECLLRAGVYCMQTRKFKPRRSNVNDEMC